MTTQEIQILKWYAEKNGLTWDAMVKDYCENTLAHAINLARAEITKDLTTEQICLEISKNAPIV